MNRITLLLASALALAVVAAPASAAERIEVVERALTDATLDLGAKGDSVGDLLTWGNPLFDAANKTQIGTDQGYCVRVVVGKSWECTWTNLLKDGQIMVEGPFYDDKDSVFAIIGGTGKYAGARGSMKLHARDAKASSYQFIFELL
jgi:allene oxide cyclase